MSDSASQPHDLLAAARAFAPARARRGGLDAQAVAQAALAILDQDGLAALTMRRVAQDLGVGLATVYAAAGGKQDILLAVVDLVLADLPRIDLAAGREVEALVALWTSTHELLVAHPAVAQLAALQPIGSAGVARLFDTTLEVLRARGLDGHDRRVAYLTLRSYVLGFTLLRVTRAGSPEAGASAPMSVPMSTEHFVEGLEHMLRGFLPDG